MYDNGTALTDLRDAWRGLRNNPLTTLVAVATLALGVGSATAVFSVFESIVVSPLPYPNAERLISIAEHGASRQGRVSAWMAHEWVSSSPSLTSVGLYTDGQWVLTGDGVPQVFRGQRVNAGFFAALGVHPLLGRLFTPDDDRSPRADVVVLSYELWTAAFGSDPGVIGRVYTLNNAPYRIVGVLNPDFQPFRMANAADEPRIYAPLGYDPAQAARCRHCAAANAIARVAESASFQRARDEIAVATRRFRDTYPQDFPADLAMSVEPLRQQ